MTTKFNTQRRVPWRLVDVVIAAMAVCTLAAIAAGWLP